MTSNSTIPNKKKDNEIEKNIIHVYTLFIKYVIKRGTVMAVIVW